MGITERREREREQRRKEILAAAWEVADEVGWGRFSVEQVAARAELGRATVYGYFESLDALIVALAEQAFEGLSKQLAEAPGLTELLDVPVRLVQANRPAYELLFPLSDQVQRAPAIPGLLEVRAKAQRSIRRLQRLQGSTGLSAVEAGAEQAFLAAIAMAAAVVPELRASTTLRHRWQAFCLDSSKSDGKAD